MPEHNCRSEQDDLESILESIFVIRGVEYGEVGEVHCQSPKRGSCRIGVEGHGKGNVFSDKSFLKL